MPLQVDNLHNNQLSMQSQKFNLWLKVINLLNFKHYNVLKNLRNVFL